MSGVVGVAGRRIDDPEAPVARFPIASAERVAADLESRFSRFRPSSVVASAACGADLIALDIAIRLGAEPTVVLPFDAPEFRRTSVVDRPDERWGPLFDRVVAVARKAGRLTVLDGVPDSAAAYHAVTGVILRTVLQLADAKRESPLAVVVWDGVRRGDDDHTADFMDSAQRLRIAVQTVPTL